MAGIDYLRRGGRTGYQYGGGGADYMPLPERPRGNPAVIKEIEDMREFRIANPNIEDVADYSLEYPPKKTDELTISDSPNDPRNMTTQQLIGIVKSGRYTPEILRELELRIPGAIKQLNLEEIGTEGDQAFQVNEGILSNYDPNKRAAEEGFLYNLRENNPDVYGKYKEPKNYPEAGFYAEPTWMKAQGGRIRKAPGGLMNLGGLEKDYRTTGGFVPIGKKEKADDVPARLSKNEFVMTADAVRAAGGGNINKGAQKMYNTMKQLEGKRA